MFCKSIGMKVFLVDDEVEALEGLKRFLEIYAPDLEIVGTATSLEDGLALIRKLDIDLLFLDISIGKHTAFDLLLAMGQQRNFHTVFVTAHDQYAIQAIREGATDYILKPIDPRELVRAIDRVRAKATAPEQEPRQGLELVLPGLNEQRVVAPSEIEFIQAQGNYCNVRLQDGEEILVSRQLIKFEQSLNSEFIRAHKSYLINLAYVAGINKHYGGSVTLKSGEQIPLGKSHKDEVMKVLEERMRFL